MQIGEVWYANFPLEEDKTQSIPRPSIIVGIEEDYVIAIKITKHVPREEDEFDTIIINWEYARIESVIYSTNI